MTLGDVIAKHRKEQGLSMDKFAELSGISKGYISMLERNKTQRGEEPSPSVDMYKSVAKVLGIDVDELLRMVEGKILLSTSLLPQKEIPSNLIPYHPTGSIPILGQIPAGLAALMVEDIEGYTSVDVHNPEECFALRIKGDSMINAGIFPGDLVIIRMQQCAENGQIVACRINGDEATLKRFKQQGDTIILMPENSNYEPIIVKCSDFDDGYASIIGVAIEVKRILL